MLHRIWNTFGIIVIGIGLALVVAFVGVRAVGLTPYAVLSGSMEPRYLTGSLIYVQHATPADVTAGDAITFRLDSGTLVTHEVYDVDEARQQFLTQGIANKNADGSTLHDAAPVPFTALVGKPVAALPLLGYVNVACTTPPGIFVIIAALGVFIGTSLIIGRAKTRPSPERSSTWKRPSTKRGSRS